MEFTPFISAGSHVLDLGCGNGLLLRFLRLHTSPGITPYGVDWLAESIRTVKEAVLPEFASNFQVANIAAVRFARGSFDSVLLDPSYLHYADVRRLVDSARRWTRPGGCVIAHTYRDTLEAEALDSVTEALPRHAAVSHTYEGLHSSIACLL